MREAGSSSSNRTTVFFLTQKKQFSRFPTNHVCVSFVNTRCPSLNTADENTVLTPRCGVVLQGMGLQSDQYILICPICVASWVHGLSGLHWADVSWLAQPFRAEGNSGVLILNPPPLRMQGSGYSPRETDFSLPLIPLYKGLYWVLLPWQYIHNSLVCHQVRENLHQTFPSQNMSQALHDAFSFLLPQSGYLSRGPDHQHWAW